MTRIGERAFFNCDFLTNVEIPDSVTSIGRDAFFDCKCLESMVIPEGATGIGSGAFTGCTALQTVEIPESVSGIEANAFDGCDHLTIIAPKGSYAIEFAKQYEIKYQEISSGGTGPELVPPDGQSDVATIRGVMAGSTGEQLIDQLRSNSSISAAATVRVLDSSGTELPRDTVLGTGMVIGISDGGSARKKCTCQVCGCDWRRYYRGWKNIRL